MQNLHYPHPCGDIAQGGINTWMYYIRVTQDAVTEDAGAHMFRDERYSAVPWKACPVNAVNALGMARSAYVQRQLQGILSSLH